jgi:hypothetical protein
MWGKLSDMPGSNAAALAASAAPLAAGSRAWPKLNNPVNVPAASEIGPESVVKAPRGEANDKVDDPVSSCKRSANCADIPDVDVTGAASDCSVSGTAESACAPAAVNSPGLVVGSAAVNGVNVDAVAEDPA